MAIKDLLEGGARGLSVVPSAPESARFGLSVGRLNVQGNFNDAQAIMAEVVRAALDLTIIRYDAGNVRLAAQLRSPDHLIWQADTLLYFDTQLPNPSPTGGYTLLELTSGQADDLSEAVRDVFADYPNHYASNPWLSREKILAGYTEWALKHLDPGVGAAFLLGDPDTGANVAVCTLTEDSTQAEITLAGVRSNARGRGVYRHLLSSVEAWLFDRGAECITISTQAGNPTPIRAWLARGYQYRSGWNTVHVMSCKAISRSPKAAQ